MGTDGQLVCDEMAEEHYKKAFRKDGPSQFNKGINLNVWQSANQRSCIV